MYLDVNWKDGTVTHVPLSQSHTVHVISPDAKVQDAFSLDGVASLTLNLDGVPEATKETPVNEGAAEGATTTNDPNATATVSDVATSAVGETQVTPDPTQQDGTASGTTSDSSGTASSDPAQPDDHAAAVDAAATTVAAAQVIAAAPEVAPADKQLQIQTALADVEQSLANWPDSAPLLDAKAQLEALAGELAQA